MSYLEQVNPLYIEMLSPLRKWKILSLSDLKKDTEYSGTSSGFYKVVSKLEKAKLIGSFKNPWNNQKYLYLLPKGIEALGENKMSLGVNKDSRFHDSIVSIIGKKVLEIDIFKKLYLDFEIRGSFNLLERIPDLIVEGELKRPFNMALEVELTQKSKQRVVDIFRTYSNSLVVNQILYITDKQSILNSYTKYLNELGGEIAQEKFLFLMAKDLTKGKVDLLDDPLWFKNQQTSLRSIFSR